MDAVRRGNQTIILTLTLREAQDLMSLAAYNVTIPDAVASQVSDARDTARAEVRDLLDTLNAALRLLTPRPHWFSRSIKRHVSQQAGPTVVAGRMIEDED